MKVFLVICLCMISFSLSAEEISCEQSDAPNPSGAKDCNSRKVNSDRYCCYIKGKMRNYFIIYDVDGCISMKKSDIDNGKITEYLDKQKSYGSKFSLDCISSYIKNSFILILFILI